MKKVLALVMTLCLLACMGSVAASGAGRVYALTMGVHKYSVNSTPADGGSIATVTYLRHKDGSTGSANRIYDIEAGETFTLTTAVKAGQEDYFTFLCWLDEKGAIIGKEPTLELTIDGSKAAFAAYAENADRHLLTYTVVGSGKVSVSSDRPLMQGDGCVSLLHGASASIRFTPALGYSTYYLKVNGEKVSFLQNAFGTLSAAVKGGKIKDVFNAALNFVRFFIGMEAVYTIPSVEKDTTFEVGFMKSALEYASALLK